MVDLAATLSKPRKRIPKAQNLMDRNGPDGLAAKPVPHDAGTRKLARDRIRSPQQAIQTHEQVGREVRVAIERIGGTMPGNPPPAEPIEQVAARASRGRHRELSWET